MGNPFIPLAPQVEDPVQQYAKVLQLKTMAQQQQLMQGQQQLQGLQIQQQQLQMSRTKALNDAFSSSVTKDANGNASFDPSKVYDSVARAGQGAVIPELQKSFMELDKLKGDVQKNRDAHNASGLDYLGSAAAQIRNAKYDPTVAGAVLAHAATLYPQETQAILQQLQQNPDSLKQVVDQIYSASPKFQTIEAQQQRAQGANKPTNATLALGAAQGDETAKAALALQQRSGKPSDVEQYTQDWLAAHGLQPTSANRLRAHAAFTQETKVQPGIARTEVFLNRPMEVADPNNPGETLMVPGTKSYGMAGKGSASVQTPRSEQRYMTSGAGGKQLTAFNTAIAHLGTFGDMADALKNGNVQRFNQISQRWAQETGSAAPVNFDAAKAALSGEIANTLKTGGATDQEIKQVENTFNRAQSPAQLRGAIGTYTSLLQAKRRALQGQYQSGMKGQPNFGAGQQGPQQQQGQSKKDFFSQFGGQARQ